MRTLILVACCLLAAGFTHAQEYSLVINHGRVIDPETGLDDIRHIGILDDRIVVVARSPLDGVEVIDATGLVVAPGFIDLHTHSPTQLGQYYQLFDGVTTALELEAGFFPVGTYGWEIRDNPLINFGASAGYLMMRMQEKNGLVMTEDSEMPSPQGLQGWFTALMFLFTDFQSALEATFAEQAGEGDRERLRALLEEGLQQGGLGIGLALDYVSEAVNAAELRMIFDVAAAHDAPIFVHIRRGVNGDPSGLREVIALAETTGAAVHVCHISHNAMRNTELFLAEIAQARGRGVDVSTEVLPYNAGSTPISAAVFGRDWQTIFDITYEDVEWAATGERFNKAMFEEYREKYPEGAVIHHYLREEWTHRAIQAPGVIIVSDMIPMKSREELVPPHNGAFTRILGRYVREQGALGLPEAIEKMTLLPAARLEDYAPAFARKGRVQPGMDADIVVFNPETVIDRATYRDPYQEAEGISHVIVNGRSVVRNGKVVEGVYPGRRLLSSLP